MNTKTKFSKADVAREYREKHGMEMPTMRLAKIMYAENKKVFKDVEDARYRLRYIEGKAGQPQRKKVSGSKFLQADERPRNPYKLPDSDETFFDPFILKAKRVAILSDIHVPYHSISAITTALDFIKKEKPDTILLNGDVIDFYGLSRFMKDPRKKNFAQEIDMACNLVNIIQDKTGARVIWKYGNHSIRYRNYIYERAAALVGFEDFDLDNIIRKRIPDITLVKDLQFILANELTIIHGHEFQSSFFSPVNVARGLFLRAKANTLCGHSHRTSSHIERTIETKMIATWSVGCLCELFPDYAKVNNWNHGFAMLDMGETTGFEVRNYAIYKNKVV